MFVSLSGRHGCESVQSHERKDFCCKRGKNELVYFLVRLKDHPQDIHLCVCAVGVWLFFLRVGVKASR